MSYINTSRKSRLTINGVDESARMISWSVNDASAFKNGIINTSGLVVLGTTALSQYDYRREAYKRGQTVQMELWNNSTQGWDLHPRGLLYVLSTSFNAEAQEIEVEIGCQLSVWTLADNIEALYNYSPTVLEGAQRTISNISQALYSSNKLIYQDNTGTIVERDIFDLSSRTDPAAVPASWSSGSKTEVLSAAPLSSSELPDIIDLDYSFVATDIFSDEEKVSTDTSNYDVVFEAVTWVREGSGDQLSSVGAIDDSYDGTPGAAIGDYVEVVDSIKVNTSRTETTTETYGGPGGQILRSVQEVYRPGVEVNAAYFRDQYSACRYQAALDGDADSTSCSYLQATSPMLAGRTIRTYTYNDEGTVTSERVESWKPVLAAAQSFNWRSDDSTTSAPVDFQTISLTDIYRDTVVITDYSQDGDGNNIETITTYRSGAVEYNAGIYATTSRIGSDVQTASEPTAYPIYRGTTSLAQPTDTVTGSGSGMTVNIAWPTSSHAVTELTVTSSLSSCQYAVKLSPGQTPPLVNITYQTASAARTPQEAEIGGTRNSAILYWGNMPTLGNQLNVAWTGGSGTGLEAYIAPAALPTLTSNVGDVGSMYSGNPAVSEPASDWTVYTTSTNFVGAATDVLVITDGGNDYEIGDTVTWTNALSAADQMGPKYAGYTRELAGSYGQSATSTTITATVSAVSPIPPTITIADPGTGYTAGDQVRVTAAQLTAALGVTITDDLVFNVEIPDGGAPDLGEGIASLSQTNLTFPSGSAPTSEYAASGGTELFRYEYNQSPGPITSVSNSVGSDGSVFSYSAYDPEGQGSLDPVSVEKACVRGSGGLQIIDNGYIRSAAVAGTTFRNDATSSGSLGRNAWSWESWVYIDSVGAAGGSLFTIGSSSYPVTYSNIPVGTSPGGSVTDAFCQLPGVWFDSSNLYLARIGRLSGSYMSAIANSVSYTQKEWFHVAVSFVPGTGTAPGTVTLYVNGSAATTTSYTLRSPDANVYIYTGSGGYSESSSDWGPSGFVRAEAPKTPNADTDYVKMALDMTRLSSGSSVYTGSFSPPNSDPAPASGPSVVTGIYEGLSLASVTGVGKAATANLEIINSSSVGGDCSGPGFDVCLVSPAVAYTEDIGEVSPSGGSGSGLKVKLGIGYSGVSYSGTSPIVVRSVSDPGTGYLNGDEVTIPDTDIEALLASYGGGLVDNGMRLSITTSYITGASAAGGGAWLFPEVVGTQYSVGDTVEVSRLDVIAANAGDPGQDIQATVTAITPSRDLQNLTLDALDGGKRVVVNTSKSDSSLPDSPDTNATPNLPTLSDSLELAVRLDSFVSGSGTKADPVEENLQVPSEYRDTTEIGNFALDYANYLSNFIIGEGYGLRIGEAMRDEIMTSWAPMKGLRYTDNRIGETFAMRADAASWGVSAEEAAVVYNGIWLGEVSYLPISDNAIDGGNFTTDVTIAVNTDSYDGGNLTTGAATIGDDVVIGGGDFTTGLSAAAAEDYLDVGKVCSMQVGLSFDAATTFALNLTSNTDFPILVDWEGSTLTSSVGASGVTHDYDEGEYTLGIYHESGDTTKSLSPLFGGNANADKVTQVTVLPEAVLPASILSAFEGCSNLESFAISANSTFASTDTFDRAWLGCSSLTTFPSLPTFKVSAVSFTDGWNGCTALVDFPSAVFDGITSWAAADAMTGAFAGCALSAESIQNILVSLDTVAAPFLANVLDIDGGTNASFSTWTTTAKAALTSLQGKGWTVNYNS